MNYQIFFPIGLTNILSHTIFFVWVIYIGLKIIISSFFVEWIIVGLILCIWVYFYIKKLKNFLKIPYIIINDMGIYSYHGALDRSWVLWDDVYYSFMMTDYYGHRFLPTSNHPKNYQSKTLHIAVQGNQNLELISIKSGDFSLKKGTRLNKYQSVEILEKLHHQINQRCLSGGAIKTLPKNLQYPKRNWRFYDKLEILFFRGIGAVGFLLIFTVFIVALLMGDYWPVDFHHWSAILVNFLWFLFIIMVIRWYYQFLRYIFTYIFNHYDICIDEVGMTYWDNGMPLDRAYCIPWQKIVGVHKDKKVGIHGSGRNYLVVEILPNPKARVIIDLWLPIDNYTEKNVQKTYQQIERYVNHMSCNKSLRYVLPSINLQNLDYRHEFSFLITYERI